NWICRACSSCRSRFPWRRWLAPFAAFWTVRCADAGSGVFRRQIFGGRDTRERDLRLFVCLADVFRIWTLQETHALLFARHERGANVADLPALRGEILADLNGSLLRRGELFHRDPG